MMLPAFARIIFSKTEHYRALSDRIDEAQPMDRGCVQKNCLFLLYTGARASTQDNAFSITSNDFHCRYDTALNAVQQSHFPTYMNPDV